MATSQAMFRILLIGSGGREHAFAWKLNQSPLVECITVVPGNGGTATGLSKTRNADINLHDMDAVVSFAVEHRINLVIPSSEEPLVAGICDSFRAGLLHIYYSSPSRM
jgi:phosphoribosylamine--glycine ligase/phosphoribosylformylglycinamidine cyclo-ligase